MRKELKESLEEIANSSIEQLKSSKNFIPKRIILRTSYPIKNSILDFNYTENCFLNDQYIIDKKINILISPHYQPKKDKTEGDWPIDVGILLKKKSINPSAYTDF